MGNGLQTTEAGATAAQTESGPKGLKEKIFTFKFVLWWSIAWGLAVMALAPVVNLLTPFQDAAYANQWTPDVYWRLVMYWHGGLFVPWVTVLATLVAMAFKLDSLGGISGKLVKDSILVGGFFAVPIAGIAGVFNVYDSFALGVPLWTQIMAFLVADEMAIALIVAMLSKARGAGGFRSVGLPFYTILVGVSGALVAAMMGHVGGWISWFGPNPAPVSDYVNATMYPVLNYYNSSAVVVFTEDVVGSHSHLMLVALMAGVVGLIGTFFGYANWSKTERRIGGFGFSVMLVSLLAATWVYIISGVGNYSPPSFFVSGANGVAGDDIVTAFVGFGAFFVMAALIMHSSKALTVDGIPLRRDPLFQALVVSWALIYLVIPVTGFYINFNETYFSGVGLNFDDIFTRFHQDFGFFVLPIVVTLILAVSASPVARSVRRPVGYLLIAGESVAFVFGETYALFTAGENFIDVGQVQTAFPVGALTLDLAVFGGVLIAVGGLVAAVNIRRTAVASHGEPHAR